MADWKPKVFATLAAAVIAAILVRRNRAAEKHTKHEIKREHKSRVISRTVPSLRVAGQVYIVTGGAMGIGEACARALAARQATAIVLFDRNRTMGAHTATQIGAEYPECRVLFHGGECGSVADCAALVQFADSQFGRVDGLVNAAGITSRGTLRNTTSDLWDSILQINLRGPFLLTQKVAAVMQREGRGGAIVNISSVHAHGGGPEHLAYGVSKSGLNYITKHNAAELMEDGIRVNSINVGWCVTASEDLLQRSTGGGSNWVAKAEQSHPTGKLLQPEDVAVTALFLLSGASARVTGSCIDMHPELVPGCLPKKFGSSKDC